MLIKDLVEKLLTLPQDATIGIAEYDLEGCCWWAIDDGVYVVSKKELESTHKIVGVNWLDYYM